MSVPTAALFLPAAPAWAPALAAALYPASTNANAHAAKNTANSQARGVYAPGAVNNAHVSTAIVLAAADAALCPTSATGGYLDASNGYLDSSSESCLGAVAMAGLHTQATDTTLGLLSLSHNPSTNITSTMSTSRVTGAAQSALEALRCFEAELVPLLAVTGAMYSALSATYTSLSTIGSYSNVSASAGGATSKRPRQRQSKSGRARGGSRPKGLPSAITTSASQASQASLSPAAASASEALAEAAADAAALLLATDSLSHSLVLWQSMPDVALAVRVRAAAADAAARYFSPATAGAGVAVTADALALALARAAAAARAARGAMAAALDAAAAALAQTPFAAVMADPALAKSVSTNISSSPSQTSAVTGGANVSTSAGGLSSPPSLSAIPASASNSSGSGSLNTPTPSAARTALLTSAARGSVLRHVSAVHGILTWLSQSSTAGPPAVGEDLSTPLHQHQQNARVTSTSSVSAVTVPWPALMVTRPGAVVAAYELETGLEGESVLYTPTYNASSYNNGATWGGVGGESNSHDAGESAAESNNNNNNSSNNNVHNVSASSSAAAAAACSTLVVSVRKGPRYAFYPRNVLLQQHHLT